MYVRHSRSDDLRPALYRTTSVDQGCVHLEDTHPRTSPTPSRTLPYISLRKTQGAMAQSSNSAPTTSTSTSASAAATTTLTIGPDNPRIPTAPFLSQISDYIKEPADVEPTMRKFNELISKYEFMSNSTAQRAEGLRAKVPDIESTLQVVDFMLERRRGGGGGDGGEEEGEGEEEEELQTTFLLTPTLYAHATIPAPSKLDEVYLWLGANIMLSYPPAEARTLLAEKLAAARGTLSNCEEDLEFIREQVTTLEVNVARVYNWDVGRRRADKDAQGIRGGGVAVKEASG